MLALGNPLHAFDFTTLARRADRRPPRRARREADARSTASTRDLVADDLVIADAERAIALAGIMGGEETEIGEGTTTVLLEAANFEPYGIYRTSERQRLRTEGSNRWEKGVDPYLAGPAAELATALILELTGATLDGRDADVHGELPARPVIALPARAGRRGHRHRDAARAPVRAPRAARLRPTTTANVVAPDLARPRHDARDRRGRGDRPLPARGRAVHAARPAAR